MPGLNGEPTKEEVSFYKRVLSKARELNRLRSVSPPDTAKIQQATADLQTLINSEPQNRFWTKVVDNPLKDATDLLISSGIFPGVHAAIEEHLKAADAEAVTIEKASIEKNPFNQVLGAVLKRGEDDSQ